MSDLHRRLSRRPSDVDQEKGGRGLLSFRSRKLDFCDSSKGKEGAMRPPMSGSRKRESLNEETHNEDVPKTPVKKSATSKLPTKYALLEAFYEGVEAAISLLGIRRQLCTFQAVCTTVEATTQRRFLLRHLAQIKHILPEAVHLDWVRSYDADTREKKWEVRISLLPMPAEEVEPNASGSTKKKPRVDTVQRRRTFHSRLVKFASTHPEEEDIPEEPLPERPLRGYSTPKNLGSTELTLPVATTCIPMEINTTSHRMKHTECTSAAAGLSHFPSTFKPSFSSRAAKSFVPAQSPVRADPIDQVEAVDVDVDVSLKEARKEIQDFVLPLRINRHSHRVVHDVVSDVSAGTPHFPPSFRPFFSRKEQVPISTGEDPDDSDARIIGGDMPSSSVHLTPSKRRHADFDLEDNSSAPAEFSSPVKTVRTISKQPEFESPIRNPHYSIMASPRRESVAFHDESSGLFSTPVKASMSKKCFSSPAMGTPGQVSEIVEPESPIRVSTPSSDLLRTPVKSFIPAESFKSPCVSTPAQKGSPSTPVMARSSFHISQQFETTTPQQHTPESPLLTPVKQQTSSMRSLKFSTTPQKGFSTPASSQAKTPIKSVTEKTPAASPGVHIPSTPGMQTPVRSSTRFKDGQSTTKRSKVNLGPLFARNSDSDACSSEDEVSGEMGSTREEHPGTSKKPVAEEMRSFRKSLSFASDAEPRDLKKSLSFAKGEVSEADVSMIQSLPAAFVQSVIDEENRVSVEQSTESVALRRKQQMMAGLPQLVNQLRMIFQSSGRSVFPYKELLSQVLSSNTEMTDRDEVEERMKMLLDLAPDWILTKPSMSGDTLLRINKSVDVLSVRRRLSGLQ